MQKKSIKYLLIIIIVAGLAWVFASVVLKKLGLTMDSLKNFNFRGGSTTKSDFYNWIIPIAKQVGADYNLPWQAIAVQTALETGWGKSSLLQTYNNFGGIKDNDGINTTKPMGTKEFINGKWITIRDGFETYSTPYSGLIGYAQFFHQNPRYSKALNHPNSPLEFIKEIKKAGYATDPNYISKLASMLPDAQKYA
jgi:flagellum-specific peptidoglycan hydrolase FlgJ